MNERIEELAKCNERIQNFFETGPVQRAAIEQFAELIINECFGILETEIELVKGYKSTACNDFDVRWHEGKILHFTKLIEKSKEHFGVEE